MTTREEAERRFTSPLWRCEKCGAWSGDGGASWRWTGTAWEHGGHDDAPQAGHFPARRFDTVAEAVAFAAAADYAPRATPPTPAEVRALLRAEVGFRVAPPTPSEVRAAAKLGKEAFARVLCMCCEQRGQRVVTWVAVASVSRSPRSVYGLDADSVEALRNATGHLFIGPDGPVPWSQLARLVAEGGA